MTKRQLIDQIVTVNHTAEPGFLALFNDQDLQDYLDHLRVVDQPRLTGETFRYEKYFSVQAVPAEPAEPDVEAEIAATATAVADPPANEQIGVDEGGLWAAREADDEPVAEPADEGFAYETDYTPPAVAETEPETSDVDEYPAAESDYDAPEPAEEDEPSFDAEPVAVGQYAESSFAETEEDMESWLF